ncbi:MAG TPA: hypothetical protein VFY40_19485 [Blastocatellia bacterium]|nr:hypothetical protein [Blastocatellia bacterium]
MNHTIITSRVTPWLALVAALMLAAIAAALAMFADGAYTQGSVQPVNDLPNPYATVENWAKMSGERAWGATSAVDIDPDGKSVRVAERCGANTCVGSRLPTILRFDASGKLVKSLGEGMFIFPHGIYVDRNGNVWVTDGIPPGPAAEGTAGRGHVVVKFSPDGKVLMTLGKAGVAGAGPDTFNQPSDVVTAPNGDIFVADGHGGNSNARIVKFSAASVSGAPETARPSLLFPTLKRIPTKPLRARPKASRPTPRTMCMGRKSARGR